MYITCFVPAEVLRGRTGSGSETPSALGVKPETTAVAVLISRRRLLTPWVDSFNRLPMPCVDSLRRCETEEPPPLVTPPFRSQLSMLMANRIEFKPELSRKTERKRQYVIHYTGLLNHMKLLKFSLVSISRHTHTDSVWGQTEMNLSSLPAYEKLWHKISCIHP